MAEIEFAGSPVTDGSGMVLFAQGIHQHRQSHVGIHLAQQFLDDLLTFSIAAFAEVAVTKIAILVEQVFRRPVPVGKGFPDFAVTVDHDGIGKAKLADAALYVRFILREGELRGVDSDYRQTLIAIALVPGLHVRKCTDAVDAGVVPEVHEDDPSPQLAKTEWCGIQPDTTDLRGANFALLNSHCFEFSSFLPTRAAQCWTSS